MKLNPQQRHLVLLLLTQRQPEGTWEQKALTPSPDGRLLIVERARIQLGILWLDVGRAIDLNTGEIDTATIKPTILPDIQENWSEFRLST